VSEHFYEDVDDDLPAELKGEVVHWMEPRPMRLGPGGVSLAVAIAFGLGAAAALAALAVVQVQKRRPLRPGWPRRRLGSS
jgi:hypothetical protein